MNLVKGREVSFRRKSISMFLLAGIVVCAGVLVLTSMGSSYVAAAWRGAGFRPQAPAADQATVSHAIVFAIQNSGAQFHLDLVAKDWLGNVDAYHALEKFLMTKTDVSQDCRKALDALARVAGANPNLAQETFFNMEKFARDDCYYASAPDQCSPIVNAGVATAKAEVPAAMAILGYTAKQAGNEKVSSDVDNFLKRAQKISFWEDSRWTSDGYLSDETPEGKALRNQWLARLSADASERLAEQAKSAAFASVAARK